MPKLIESYLSKKPPWPGSVFPESFALNFLFIFDRNKSPNSPDIEINKDSNAIIYIFNKFK